MHVESLTELRRIEQTCSSNNQIQDQKNNKECRILLRTNIALAGLPSTKLVMGGKPTPFGFDECELATILDFIKHHHI